MTKHNGSYHCPALFRAELDGEIIEVCVLEDGMVEFKNFEPDIASKTLWEVAGPVLAKRFPRCDRQTELHPMFSAFGKALDDVGEKE